MADVEIGRNLALSTAERMEEIREARPGLAEVADALVATFPEEEGAVLDDAVVGELRDLIGNRKQRLIQAQQLRERLDNPEERERLIGELSSQG